MVKANEHLRELATRAWERLEQHVRDFEQAWQGGQRPVLEAHLPDAPAAERLAILLELVHIDLEYRLKAGEPARAEDYLQRFPELTAQRPLALDLIVAEHALRRRTEPDLGLEEYRRRFPEHAVALAAQLVSTIPQLTVDEATAGRLARRARAGPTLPTVSGYEVLEVLGRGGMGVVYKARQLGLNRVVALKMILSGGHADRAELARFRTEAEAVARLQHPGIVQIHETGMQEGLPYFSLEFVEGGSLNHKLQGTPLPPNAAARLTALLAQAVQAAHDHGILHRDLKPANVFLMPTNDSSGVPIEDRSGNKAHYLPKVGDFGLAKKLDENQGQTRTGVVMGTPSYMAPEQAAGQSSEVGPAADIYALGALLYELLTGRPPFKAATTLDTVWQVLHQEPVPPSRLQPRIPQDLETVCLKCLQKAPGQRYGRACDLAEDLRRFQAHEPILARPVSAWRRLAKWTRRRPALAALIVVSMLALMSLLVSGLLWSAEVQEGLREVRDAQVEAGHHRSAAQKARTDGEAFRAEARREKVAGESIRKTAEEVKGQADAKLDHASRILFALNLAEVEGLWRRDPGRALDLLNDKQQSPSYLRDFTWGHYQRLCRRDRLTLQGNAGAGHCVALCPQSATLVVGGKEGRVRLVAAATGQEQFLRTQGTAPILATTFASDGQTLACGDAAGLVYLWDMPAGRLRATLAGHKLPVLFLAFSVDGRTLASAGSSAGGEGEVRLWDAVNGTSRAVLPQPLKSVTALALAPHDGTALVVGTQGGGLTFWDIAARKERRQFRLDSQVTALAYTPDGKVLATATAGGLIQLRDSVNGNPLTALQAYAAGVYSLAYTPDGRTLAAGYEGGPILLWDTQTKTVRATLRGHNGRVRVLACAVDGRLLASRDEGGTVKVWQLATEGAQRTLLSPIFLPRSLLLSLLGKSREIPVHQLGVQAVAFAPHGKQLASGSVEGAVVLWDDETGQKQTILPSHPGGVSSLAYQPQGTLLASAGYHNTVKLYDLKTRQVVATLEGHTQPVVSVVFAPDGRTLASASWDGTLRLWDVSGRQQLAATFPSTQLTALAYGPDGNTLAVAAVDGTVCLWDPRTQQIRRTLRGHKNWATAVAFSADGRLLASADGEGQIKLWDVATGQEHLSCQGRRVWIYALAFSPDGRTLVSGSGGLEDVKHTSGVVTLWDPATGRERAVWREHIAPVQAVAFSPSGRTLASASRDGTVKLWEADPYSP